MEHAPTNQSIDIKRILFATDLSENARHAFAYAASLANRYEAAIVILHVLQEVPEKLDQHIIGYIGTDRWEEIKSKHYTEAREALIGKKRGHVAIEEALGQFSTDANQASNGAPFDTDEIIVTRGNPVEEILRQADEKQCDMIIMGLRGHSPIEEIILGSTVKRVLKQAKIPVLAIPMIP